MATFEVVPDVQIGDLSGITIERPKLKVTEDDVDKTVEVLRKQRATYEPTDRAAEMGDSVAIEFSSQIDGQEVEKQPVKPSQWFWVKGAGCLTSTRIFWAQKRMRCANSNLRSPPITTTMDWQEKQQITKSRWLPFPPQPS